MDPQRVAFRGTSRLSQAGGFMLVETLLAIVILGLAFSGILAGIGTIVASSDLNGQYTSVEVTARSLAEQAKAATWVDGCPGGYSLAGPAGMTVATTVAWSSGGTWSSTCLSGAALQRVTITVSTIDGRATRSLDVVKRNPS